MIQNDSVKASINSSMQPMPIQPLSTTLKSKFLQSQYIDLEQHTKNSKKLQISKEKHYYQQYKQSNPQRNLYQSKSQTVFPMQQEPPNKKNNKDNNKEFRIKKNSSRIIEKGDDQGRREDNSSAISEIHPLLSNQVITSPQQQNSRQLEENAFTPKRKDLTIGETNEDQAYSPSFPSQQTENLKIEENPMKSSYQVTSQTTSSNKQFNLTQQSSSIFNSSSKGLQQKAFGNSKQWNITTSNLKNKEQLLMKQSKIDNTATRFWNNVVFNPGQVVNKQNNSNPLIPEFFQGPQDKEIIQDCSDQQKMIYYLKKEMEDIRSQNKHTSYTKKDLMLRMLIDEVERQHKRINFLESKVREQKQKIVKLEDALMQRSHRLLLRCSSTNKNHREFMFKGPSKERCVSAKQKQLKGFGQARQQVEEEEEYQNIQQQNSFNRVKGSDEEESEEDQIIEVQANINNSRRQLPQLLLEQEVQTSILLEPESLALAQEATDVIYKPSMILQHEDQLLTKVIINREDLMQEVCGNQQSQQQIEANVSALIQDLEKAISNLKQMNNLLDYETQNQQVIDKQNFHQILEDFQNKASQILNCEQVIFTMIDQSSKELLQFTKSSLLKHKFEDLFEVESDMMKDSILLNDPEALNQFVKMDRFKAQFGLRQGYPLENMQLQKFQVQGKQGIAFALNSNNFLKKSFLNKFPMSDHEILDLMSSSCLRKLNRERDIDLKNKLIHSYKELFKIGVNLDSRYNYQSLLQEAEKRLKEIMKANLAVILIIDHENMQFIKLNPELTDCLEVNNLFAASGSTNQLNQLSQAINSPDKQQDDNTLQYVPMRGLANISVSSKKTLVITEPLSYSEYDKSIDMTFPDNNAKPIICVPIMDREEQKVEGCIQLEFKMRHYLSNNPLLGGSGSFKLDIVTKEILEIFSNQLRTSILRIRILKKYMNRKQKSFHYTMAGSAGNGFMSSSPSPLKFSLNGNDRITVKDVDQSTVKPLMEEDLNQEQQTERSIVMERGEQANDLQ